ncbi:MAG: hypothetical protein H6621_03060 [Halobacteriovoraceae bacterium]|nr:hypothetical protein [Halobacteriovoraceae bacterium]MCB9094025.1 hypothetical protein [Halobacteriovoraceae bacterium]
MLKTIILASIVLSSSLAISSETAHNCFRKHILDAIELNKQRKPLYEAISDGESKKISNKLISMEYLLIPISLYFDLSALRLQNKGVPLMCDEFIDMSETPPFTALDEIPKTQYNNLPTLSIEEKISQYREAMDQNSFTKISKLSEKYLKELEKYPSYFCLYRHFTESILRASNKAMQYQAMALKNEVKFDSSLSWRFIDLQVSGLKRVNKIDILAAPLQFKGIPIICNDVPHIPAN